jgi:hypothetical protein
MQQSKIDTIPVSNDYIFCGYRFSLPIGIEIHCVSFWDQGYIVHTTNGDLTIKACHKCKRMRSLTEFYDGRSPCKECHILLVKSWRKRNPDKVKAMRKSYVKRRKAREAL